MSEHLDTRPMRVRAAGPQEGANMDHYAETEFFPALENAIRLVGGTYDPRLPSQSSIPAHTWETFLSILATALGPEWEVAPVVAGNSDRAGAQRNGRGLPITFKHPYEKREWQDMIRLIFDEAGIQ